MNKMNKKYNKKYFQLAGVCAFLFFSSSASKGKIYQKIKKSSPPNIIFIVTDDQRWDMLGCAGNQIIQTPNIDKMASSGVRFSHAFVTTPICAASRASILTGLYERTHDFTSFFFQLDTILPLTEL